ncbi:MAG: hypothetical protein HPY57_15295 [Ignavibacteria bacterium]|nr:hypothetical protein [Ignavibacteria bacterium]
MLLILLIILCSIFLVFVGYRLAISIHDPKRLKQNIDDLKSDNKTLSKEIKDLENINKDLIEGVKKLDETVKSNTNWYLQNINALGQYLKDKYNDNYVFDQLKNIQGIKPVEKKEYNIDDLLDKLSVGGWNSLTKDEIDYLRSQGNV